MLANYWSSMFEEERRKKKNISLSLTILTRPQKTHDKSMKIVSLPFASYISNRSFFRWIYIFVEECSQRICLVQLLYIKFLDNHHVKTSDENEQRTFGIGKNIVGTMRAGTYISGIYSSSSYSEGGGGTSFCRLGIRG